MSTKPGELHLEVRGTEWKGIDFSRASLRALRLHSCRIVDCVFSGADLRELRMWGTTLISSSFENADPRDSALGGVGERGERNTFERVDFTRADLRRTAHTSADFRSCVFASTKLSKVEFEGDVFVDCRFEGLLDEVIFDRHAFRGERFPPNEMRGVDFRNAQFKDVLFRHLDMDEVAWPVDDQHLVFDNYKPRLEAAVKMLASRGDAAAKQLHAKLAMP